MLCPPAAKPLVQHPSIIFFFICDVRRIYRSSYKSFCKQIKMHIQSQLPSPYIGITIVLNAKKKWKRVKINKRHAVRFGGVNQIVVYRSLKGCVAAQQV